MSDARADLQFLQHLQKQGILKWEVFGSEGYFRITGKDLFLDDKFPDGVWSIFSLPFFIGIKVLRKGVEQEWPTLDWPALEAEGRRLSESFRMTQDY